MESSPTFVILLLFEALIFGIVNLTKKSREIVKVVDNISDLLTKIFGGQGGKSDL